MALTLIDNSERAGYTLRTQWILLIFSIGMLFINFRQLSHSGYNPFGDDESFANLLKIIAVGSLIASVVAVITFIAWMRRAYGNLHALEVGNLAYSPGMAVGGWFIPLANLAIPAKIMSEIWQHTMSLAGPDQDESNDDDAPVPKTSPVGGWWFFRLSGALLPFVPYVVKVDHSQAGLCSLAGAFCSLIAVGMTISMVKTLSEAEKRIFARVEKEVREGKFQPLGANRG